MRHAKMLHVNSFIRKRHESSIILFFLAISLPDEEKKTQVNYAAPINYRNIFCDNTSKCNNRGKKNKNI